MADKNLRVSIMLQMAEKVLGPLKNISQGSNETAQTLKAAREQLKQLQAVQGDIGSFQRLQQTLGETESKLKSTREHLRATANAFAENDTKKTSAAMLSAAQAADKLGAKFNAQQQQLKGMSDKLGAAGIDTKNLASSEELLASRVAATTLDIAKQTQALKLQSDVQKRAASIKREQDANVAARGNARGALLDGIALTATLGAPIKMAVDFESSMADVAKVMDFGDDKNGLAKLSQSAIELSKTLPMAAKDIAQIMALGGQSGLSSAELLGGAGKVGFAEHAIKMGTAFGMTAEEAGTSMAKMKSAFGMSIPEVATLTDKINLLGNTGAANEKQILNIVTRVGPLGAVAGVASGQIAALGSTLAGMGVQEEVAATGIQNFMLALTSGASATKKQREMLKDLGLESTQVAKAMQTDAQGTMLKVLQSVKMLPKHEQAAALTELFGKESIKAIAPLLTQLDTLKENFDKVADASRYGGAVDQEYAARAATTANQLQLAKNQAAAMGITLGNVMLPALNDTLKTIMPWVSQITTLAQAYPGVTKAIVMGVAALMLFKIVAIAGAYAFTFLKGAWLAGQAVLFTLRTAWMLHTGALVAGTAASRTAMVVSKAMTAAQWLFNAAMSANPIGLLIVAIVGLIAAGLLLWRNWDQVVAGGKALWQDFMGWLSGLWVSISATASTAWAGMVQSFTQFGGWIIDGVIGGITGKLSALKETIVGAAGQAASWFKEKLGIASPSKVFTQFGGWISEGAAQGIETGQASVRAAAVALAGAAMLPVAQAESSNPAAATPIAAIAPAVPRGVGASAAPAAAGNTYQITVNAAPGMDAQAIARAVAAELDRRERQASARRKSAMHEID